MGRIQRFSQNFGDDTVTIKVFGDDFGDNTQNFGEDNADSTQNLGDDNADNHKSGRFLGIEPAVVPKIAILGTVLIPYITAGQRVL
jgi:hypothetical protein